MGYFTVERQAEDGSWTKVGMRGRNGFWPAAFATLEAAKAKYVGPQYRFVRVGD